MTRHPVLRPGDTLRLGGETRTVAGLDGATVRLADVTGVVTEMPTAGLLADPSLELVTGSRVPIAPQPALERLPAETVDNARWWERHLIEVITGVGLVETMGGGAAGMDGNACVVTILAAQD
jgi:putative transposase